MSVLLTVKEAAEWLGISRATFDKLVRDDGLPVVRFSERLIRVRVEDLKDYAARKTAGTFEGTVTPFDRKKG